MSRFRFSDHSPLKHEVDALAEAVIARRVHGGLLCEVGVELRDVVLGGEGGLEGRLQLAVDHVRPADVLEEGVALDGLGVGGAAAQPVADLVWDNHVLKFSKRFGCHYLTDS